MKNALVIAYYFPPLGMGGVQRTFKFCKYLPQFGWHPIVITVKDIAYPEYDPTPLDESPTEVLRTESLDPLRLARFFGSPSFENSRRRWSTLLSWFLIPDSKLLWLPFVLSAARSLLRAREISLIFATSPPLTSLIAGWLLKKASRKPLVIDLRDPLGYGLLPPTFLHSRAIRFLTRKVVDAADRIIAVYPQHQVRSVERKVTVIPNGFDPEDFVVSEIQANKFLIVHTGTLTKKRNGLPLLMSVKKFVQSRQVDKNVVKVKLVGWVDPSYAQTIKKEGLSEVVELFPYVSHKESVQHLMSSSLLWLPVGEEEIPGKVYEYLGSRRPIIATAPEGDCAALIRMTRSGVVIDPANTSGIVKALIAHYRLFVDGKSGLREHRDLGRFNRMVQTKTLASLFDEVAQ